MKYDLTIMVTVAFYIFFLREESKTLLESAIEFIASLCLFLVVRWFFVVFTCMKRAADDGEHYEATGKIDTARTDSEKIMVTHGDRSWRPVETKDSRMMMYKIALILWTVTALVVSYCVTIHSKEPETLTECLKRIQLIIIASCFFIFVLSILSCFLLSEEDDVEPPCTSQSLQDADIERLEADKQEKLKKIVLDAGFKKDNFLIDTKYWTYLALKEPLRHSILRNKYYIL
ncbi:hypothetical protein B9Z55_028602 [Caenorhabditis nigoni]|uniref:Uncharacterized protein n=2 Tax=Caenorhabditis nigoni TaxID=1611254 RepID=A0A2G5SB47_9PELO|nr:hypothetical protein B9Z55_028602 [Caenorhabditis nigoni]